MAKERDPLSADAQRALDLLRRTGDQDWFIFDAMEVVADGGVERPYTVLEELGRADLGQIYDGQRRFRLTEASAVDAALEVAHVDTPPSAEEAEDRDDPAAADRADVALAAAAAAADDELGGCEADDLEPVNEPGQEYDEGLSDEAIAALARWKGGPHRARNGRNRAPATFYSVPVTSGLPRFENQTLLGMVLAELLALQLTRKDGLPGDPSLAVYNRLVSGPGRREAVTRTDVANAIAYCRRRGWLQTHHNFFLVLTGRGRFMAHFLGQERFSAWGSAPAWVYNKTTGQWLFAKVPKPSVNSVPSTAGGKS